MSLKEEILPYFDGNGLIAPNVVPQGTQRGSDNGVMFLSEYYIMLTKIGQLSMSDHCDYAERIATCIGEDEELHRAPGDSSPDEVDDYYGVYAGFKTIKIDPMLKLPIRLWRQPQLLLASLYANETNPLMIPIKYALSIYAALVIATSCVFTPIDNADARRLSWLLIQATQQDSFLCRLAAKIWFRRAYRQYGVKENVMREVAKRYYQNVPEHPFIRYWID